MFNTHQEFIDYVLNFYAEGEIYDMRMTAKEAHRALNVRLQNEDLPFEGDSVDREMVRDIVLANRQQLV